MTSVKYIGLDVHKESISICVRNSVGKVVMESVIETKASTILQFIDGLRGDLRVTFEEGTWAAWLYDLLKPHVSGVEVCNPRKNALLKDGSKSDRIDANKLSEQLYMNNIKSVYHGEHGLRTLKELARSYLTISKDLTRVMNRLKASYRSWAIPCAGKEVYAPRHRAEWLGKIANRAYAGGRSFTTSNWMPCDVLRQEVRRDLLREVKKHQAWKRLRQIPGIGPIRAAVLMAVMQTPHRFRTKRQLWTYSGLGLETHDSGEYRAVQGQLQRAKKQATVHGPGSRRRQPPVDLDRLLDRRQRVLAAPQVAEPVRLVVQRHREVGQERVRARRRQPPVDLDGLLDRRQRLLAAPQLAEPVRLVVQRPREVGQERVRARRRQPPAISTACSIAASASSRRPRAAEAVRLVVRESGRPRLSRSRDGARWRACWSAWWVAVAASSRRAMVSLGTAGSICTGEFLVQDAAARAQSPRRSAEGVAGLLRDIQCEVRPHVVTEVIAERTRQSACSDAGVGACGLCEHRQSTTFLMRAAGARRRSRGGELGSHVFF